ncbi:ribonuclease H-like domain-containing protein [Nannocystaceae bacterium ST9]
MPTPSSHLERLADVHRAPRDRPHTAHAALRSVRQATDRGGTGYWDLVLEDASAKIPAKIWSDSRAFAEAATSELREDMVVKIMFTIGTYKDALQLSLLRIRPAGEGEGWTMAEIRGEGFERVADLRCSTLVFDIETVPGVDPAELPESIAKNLARSAERWHEGDESKVMGLSPYFGKVVSLAIGDGDRPPGEQTITVLTVTPPGSEGAELPAWIRPMSEAELLRSFWHLANHADLVVSYNGRGFDVPFLQVRSLVHDIPARVDLMSRPHSLRPHLDLYRLLGQGRAGSTSLDVVCWALGVPSPKTHMDGSQVGPAYARGEIEAIAEYNAADVRATIAVYQQVRDRLLTYRADW